MNAIKHDAFLEAFTEIIGIEGGYVDNPYDKGGATKFGISSASYPDLDIKNLTLQQAQEIYYRDYWANKRLNLDQINNYKIQRELFDTAINMGVYTAALMMQKSLNLMNRNGRKYADLIEDGWIGNNTMKAYNKVKPKIFYKVLNGFQFCRYKEIVENNPSQEIFFVGWMKRI